MSIAEEVVQMIREAANVDAAELRPDTQLWRDLRIGGDDMLELFLKLQKRYGVNLDGLHLPTYSPNEDDVITEQIAKWTRKKLHIAPSDRYKSLTVADLIAVAERKNWSQPT